MVTGSSPFTITWIKVKKRIKSSQKCIIDSENIRLKIQECDVDDTGSYQCVVTNDVGGVTCAATLSLKGWFTDGSHGKHQVLCSVLSLISVTSSRGSASKICSDDRKCLCQLGRSCSIPVHC